MKHNIPFKFIILLPLLLLLISCAEKAPCETLPLFKQSASFWLGLWHGFILFFSLLGKVINLNIGIQEDKTIFDMTELIEMTEGKSLTELEIELDFQLKNGENLGGTIVSHISHHINIQKIKVVECATNNCKCSICCTTDFSQALR